MTTCSEPDCDGVLDADGHCTTCGMKARPPLSGPTRPQASASSAPPTTPSVRAGRTPNRTTKVTRTKLGAGLVEIEPTPAADPRSAIIDDPRIREDRRFCSNASCGKPVGRARDGEPGRTEGFCPGCGRPFSFRPQLAHGDLVAGQYAVEGCIAHGGLGWIYLARARDVADKWVVLKGLLDRTDPDAVAAALAELRFLAEIEHPSIVRIINNVRHRDDVYIVMDYVPGVSLKAMLDARREANGGTPDSLPVAEAIAYVLEILPAFAYLHRMGVLYCDFKPDNLMHTGNSVKLIDLGAAYRVEQPTATVYGTRGYQAPEIAVGGPTVASDLFTIGRTLFALCCTEHAVQSRYEFSLPDPDTQPRFRRYDALYRFLQRATATDPDDRFQSADEMAAQLLGVLRQVVARESGRRIAASSELFAPELRTATDAPDWRRLPTLLVSADDPAAGFLASLPTGAASTDDTLALLAGAPEQSIEVQLRQVRELVVAERGDDAATLLTAIEENDPWEWRVAWYRGLLHLQHDEPARAVDEFDVVYRTVPGELAPALALAFSLEALGHVARAAGWYDIVSGTDPAYASAAFGLARCCLEIDDVDGALAAYDRVPVTAHSYTRAQVAMADAMLGDRVPSTHEQAVAAAAVVDGLPVGPERARLEVRLFTVALEALDTRGRPDASVELLGHDFDEVDVRFGLEAANRKLARYAETPSERIRLIDDANQARPVTFR